MTKNVFQEVLNVKYCFGFWTCNLEFGREKPSSQATLHFVCPNCAVFVKISKRALGAVKIHNVYKPLRHGDLEFQTGASSHYCLVSRSQIIDFFVYTRFKTSSKQFDNLEVMHWKVSYEST